MAIGKLQLANSKLALIAKPKTKQGRDPKARFKDKIQRQGLGSPESEANRHSG
jgi:hypothetical protein